MRAVGIVAQDVSSGPERDHTVEHAVLLTTARGLGFVVAHLPDNVAVAVFDAAVIEHLAVPAFAQRVDTQLRFALELERLAGVLVISHLRQLRDGNAGPPPRAHERPDVGW